MSRQDFSALLRKTRSSRAYWVTYVTHFSYILQQVCYRVHRLISVYTRETTRYIADKRNLYCSRLPGDIRRRSRWRATVNLALSVTFHIFLVRGVNIQPRNRDRTGKRATDREEALVGYSCFRLRRDMGRYDNLVFMRGSMAAMGSWEKTGQ